MNILIIEDEQLAAQRLVRHLKEIDATIQVVSILRSVVQSINWLLTNPQPDLILMDIQLEDGISFEIFETYRTYVPIIFTTAYDQYTLRAFKVNSVDYLLKPIAADELRAAIYKLNTIQSPQMNSSILSTMFKHLQPQAKERFLIKIGEHYKSVSICNIQCFYLLQRNVFIMTDTSKSYPIDYSLDKIEELIDANVFFRINRNHIIHINSIQDIIMYSSTRLKIILRSWKENEELIVSRERVKDFKKWMDR